MPLYAGALRIARVYRGAVPIARVYRGTTRVHAPAAAEPAIVSIAAVAQGSGVGSLGTVNLGTAPSAGQRRFMVLAAGTFSASSHDITAASIASNAMSAVFDSGPAVPGSTHRSVWMLEVPTGTSAALSISCDRTQFGWQLYSVIVENGVLVKDGDGFDNTAPLSVGVDYSDGGVVVALSMNRNGTLSTWGGGVTEDYDVDVDTSDYFSAAHSTILSGSGTMTVTNNATGGSEECAAAVSFKAVAD